MRSLATLSLAALLFIHCDAGMSEEAPTAESGKADEPGFSVRARTWHLIPDGLSAGDDSYDLDMDLPADVQVVDVWIDRQWAARFEPRNHQVSGQIDLSELAAGSHQVLFQANARPIAFAVREIRRSAPLYVVVSNDWDDPDNGDAMLERQERLHSNHPELLLTHLVGPYTFTDPNMSLGRQQLLVDWVLNQARLHGDEIGLHIHPYCSFVESAQVACKDVPSFAKTSDPSGYTVRLGAYSEDEFVTLLNHAIELFEDHGLGRPTAFRAGGWTLEAKTMRALERTGFVADSSAVHWEKLEEWEGHAVATLFPWNREQWSTINARSQPYYPNRDELLSSSAPQVAVLEVPDNGALVDYVTRDEMVEIFDENYSGQPLDAPRALSIGYHPPNFSEAFFTRINGALDHIDENLASQDRGAVVYARMSDLARVWQR